MFDAHLQPLLRRAFEPSAKRLVAIGVSADSITLVGFGFGAFGYLFIGGWRGSG